MILHHIFRLKLWMAFYNILLKELYLDLPGILLTVTLARSARLRFLWAPLVTEYRFSSWKPIFWLGYTCIISFITQSHEWISMTVKIEDNYYCRSIYKTNRAIFFQPAFFITCKDPFHNFLHYSLSAISFFLCSWYLFIHAHEEIGVVDLPFYTSGSVSGLYNFFKQATCICFFLWCSYLALGTPELIRLIMLSISDREGISMCDWLHISSSSFCFFRKSSFILLAFNWSSLLTSASALKTEF